jgi:chromate transporter
MSVAEEAGASSKQEQPPGTAREVLAASTRLGLTSFGGPVAHLGYFREEYVDRRHWLDDQSYADLVALCQFLPGPASSQVGISIGILRAGLRGGIAAWLGFTLPSAIAMVIFAYGVRQTGAIDDAGWLHGLKIAAVAVVAYAVWGMARTLCPDSPRATMAIGAAIVALASQTATTQVGIIVVAGLIGWRLLEGASPSPLLLRVPISRHTGIAAWVIFFGLLVALPLARQFSSSHALAMFDAFYRVGSLVFGGGHVVLPLLQTEVVPPGWLTNEQFIAGYGAAQAVPGPLFTFSAYLGAIAEPEPNGVAGATIALVAVFLPSFLLVIGALPLWGMVRSRPSFQAALGGINAAVVGILLAALYTPVWTSAIGSATDFSLGLAAFGLLAVWRLPPWMVVVFCAVGGAAIT